jgi:hypothetical protein
MFSRTTAVAALLAAASLALGGCAAGSEKSDAKADVLTLLRTESAKSLQTSLDKTEKAQSAAFTVDGKSDGEATSGKGTVSWGDTPQGVVTMDDAEDGPTEVRYTPTAVWFSIPEKNRAEMSGLEWMKVDLAAAAKLAGDSAESKDMLAEHSRQLRDTDPSAQLRTLLAQSKVTVVGEETVGGVKTVHFTGTQPLSAYLAEIPAKDRPAVEEKLTKAGVKDVKLDVWVDDQYQPRRTHTVVGTIDDLTVNFSDYGAKIELVEPPAAKTGDLVKLLQEMAKAAGQQQ